MDAEREKWIRAHPAWALDTLSRRLERSARSMSDICQHLIEQRATISTLTAKGHAASSGAGSDISNPTLKLVERYDQYDRQLAAILDGIVTAWVCVDMLDTDSRQALGMHAPATTRTDTDPDWKTAPRCIGDNTPDGAICWNIPSARRLLGGTEVDDGRCHECGPRHDALRRAASDARRMRRHHETLGQ